MDHTTDVDREALEAWKQEERSVTLTNAEWTRLTTYIVMTTKHRQNEAQAWEKLAAEKNADGTPKYRAAQSNAEYWHEMDQRLEQIRQKIDLEGVQQ